MDAKHIAQIIIEMTDLHLAGNITIEQHGTIMGALWELAASKGLREEVTDILRRDAMAEWPQ